jgi:hypothetical protein
LDKEEDAKPAKKAEVTNKMDVDKDDDSSSSDSSSSDSNDDTKELEVPDEDQRNVQKAQNRGRYGNAE